MFNKSFEELLEKTSYPEQQKADLRNMADTLDAIGVLAQADLQKEVAEIIENLPEIRKQRAQAMRESAQGLPKNEKALRLKDADRLAASAEKLKLPTADEQFKNRAVLTELSLQLRGKVAGIEEMVSELDPARMDHFRRAMQYSEQSLPPDLPLADRHQTALYAFASEVRAAGFEHVDQAVDNFYRNTVAVYYGERGHRADVGLDQVPGGADVTVPSEQHTQDYLTQRLLEQDNAEHLDRVKHNKLLINMPVLAAEHLKPKEYAAYRVMIENEHLIDWKIENSKVIMKARTLNAGDQENTIGKILQRELDYQHVRGANLTVQQTIRKMNVLLKQQGREDMTPSPKASERMQKSTNEVLRDAKKKGPER